MSILGKETIRKLIQKLKTENDISLKEADQLFSCVELFAKTILKQGVFHDSMLLIKWYEVVASKIRAGYSGNFIFTIPLSYSSSYFYNYLRPALEALQDCGKLEDRIEIIRANQKMLSLLPKYFPFEWEELGELYVLHGDRAGFYRYPLQKPGSGEAYTVSQVFKKILSSPIVIPQEEITLFSKANKIPYFLKYLKQKVPYMEIKAMYRIVGETAIFTNKEEIAIAQTAAGVSFEELVENAVAQNIINKEAAAALLKGKGEDRYIDAKFTEASVKYIDDMVKRKMEWKAVRKAVEEEPEWLEEVR